LLPVAACVNNPTPPNETSVEAILLALTSEGFGGRGLGSEGNVKAGEYIADLLQQAGLEPFFDGSYFMEYEDILLDPSKANAQVTVMLSDGSETGLVVGEDYTHSLPHRDIDIEAALSYDAALCAEQGLIFMSEDRMEAFSFSEDPSNMTVNLNPERYMDSSGVTDAHDRGVCIHLISDRARELVTSEGARLRVKMNATATQGIAKNVAAYLPGTVGENAYVVLAHFDGSGKSGKLLYPSAYDNASGVAAVLRTAMLFMQSKPTLENDVIYLFTNGEETGRDGAKAFVTHLANRYASSNIINVDCIGYKGRNFVDIYVDADCEDENPLAQALAEAMRSLNATVLLDTYSGDPSAFYGEKGILTAPLSDTIWEEPMHTPDDNLNLLDFERIEAVAQALAGFLIANGNEVYQANVHAVEGHRDMILQEQIARYNQIISEHNVGENEFCYEYSLDYTSSDIPEIFYSCSLYLGQRIDTCEALLNAYPMIETIGLGDFVIASMTPLETWMLGTHNLRYESFNEATGGYVQTKFELPSDKSVVGGVYPLSDLDPMLFRAGVLLILKSEAHVLALQFQTSRAASWFNADSYKDAAQAFDNVAFDGIHVFEDAGSYNRAVYHDASMGNVEMWLIADENSIGANLPISAEGMVHFLDSIDFNALLAALQQPDFWS